MTGFTLLEVVVTVTIISLLTLIVTSALPVTRRQQQLQLARQSILDLLQQAQHRALNEVRPDDCVSRSADPRSCSDVGVAVKGGQLILFADTAQPQDWHYTERRDFIISRVTLPAAVTVTDSIGAPITRWRSWTFVGTPPTLQLFINSNPALASTILTPGRVSQIMLQADSTKQPLTISAYGQVD